MGGFRSRWMMPTACASATASAACSNMSTDSSMGNGPRSASTADRSLPSRNSMTMKGSPDSSLETSNTRATCSLRSLTEALASRRNRASASGFVASLAQHHLDRDTLLEILVPGSQHRPHAANRQHPLDQVLAGDHVARAQRALGGLWVPMRLAWCLEGQGPQNSGETCTQNQSDEPYHEDSRPACARPLLRRLLPRGPDNGVTATARSSTRPPCVFRPRS